MYILPDLLKSRFPKDVKKLSVAIEQSLYSEDDKRDVRPLMSLLMRLKQLDTRLRRHVQRRKTTIFSADWGILPYDNKNQELAQKAKFRLEKCIKHYFDEFVNAELYGVSLARLAWMPGAMGMVPDIERRFLPVELEFNPNYFLNTAILEDAESNKFTRLAISENERHLYLSRAFQTEEPGGILVSTIFHEYMLNLSYQEWTVFIQFLKGIVQGKALKGATKEEKKAGAEAVKDVVQQKFVFTSDKVGFDFHKIVDENAGKSFGEIQRELKDDIEIAITGTSSLASDRQRNAPTVQQAAEEDFAYWSRLDFCDVMNEQLLVWDYYMNINKSSIDIDLPYYFAFIPKKVEDKEANARILDMVREMAPIPQSEITRLTGVKIAEPGSQEPVIQSSQAYVSPNLTGGANGN
jgi:phage gp29-like protein